MLVAEGRTQGSWRSMDETHERRPAIAATPEDLEGTPAPRRDRDRPKDIGSAEG